MMLTRFSRTIAVVLGVLAATSGFSQSKVDQAVGKALAQIDKAPASKDPVKAIDDVLKAAEKLKKEGTPEALWGASVIEARAGKLEQAAATAKQALDASASAPPELRARVLAHAAGLDMLRGTTKDALENATQAAKAHPTAETLAVLALAQAHARESVLAVESAEKAVQADPASAVAHDALGAALTAAGKHAEAEAALKKALELDPRLYRAHVHRSQALIAAGKGAEAEAAAREAIAIAPQHGIGFGVLAAAMVAKDPKLAAEALNEAAQGQFLAEDRSPFLNYTRGRIFELLGRNAEATAAYRKAIEIDPGYTPGRTALVGLQVKRGEYDAVFDEAKRLAEENLGDGEAQLIYGQLLMRKGDPVAALEPLDRAAELLPKSADAQALLGVAYGNRQPADAVKAFLRAVELAPDNVDYRTRLGLFLGLTGQTPAAIAELNKVINSPGYKSADAHINLGFVYANAEPKKPVEAAIAYKRAVEIDPKSAQAWLGLGRAQLFAKSFKDALVSLDKVPQLEPKLKCEALITAAAVHIQLASEAKNKDVTGAKAALAQAKTCQSGDPRLAKLEKALEQVERGEVAEQTEVEEKQPRGPDIATVHAKLVSPKAEVRRAGAREMVTFGADAVQYLLPMLNTDSDIGVRTAVAKALGAIGAPAARACSHLQTEMNSSAERVVLPVDTGKKVSAAEDMARINREKELQAACREARAKIGCR